jgi:hypothetical protein
VCDHAQPVNRLVPECVNDPRDINASSSQVIGLLPNEDVIEQADIGHGYIGLIWTGRLRREIVISPAVATADRPTGRFQAPCDEAAPHTVDESVTRALNKESGLFGPDKSLGGRFQRDGAWGVLAHRHRPKAAVPDVAPVRCLR